MNIKKHVPSVNPPATKLVVVTGAPTCREGRGYLVDPHRSGKVVVEVKYDSEQFFAISMLVS